MTTIANITVTPHPQNPAVQVINASGELDESNLPTFEATVNPVIQNSGVLTVIFNFEGLEFMSSKIIGYLASVFTSMQNSQRNMILAAYNQTIADILILVGLNQMMPSYATLDEALQVTATPANPPTSP